MNYSAEQIQGNWNLLLSIIEEKIAEPRKSQLLEFYTKYENRIALMPASSKVSYHNAFAGGYVDHVLRVIKSSLTILEAWKSMEADTELFTEEELVFAALNHDLGKLGTNTEDLYVASKDDWRRKNLGEVYTINGNVDFMNIPDRSLFLLQEAGIKVSINEMLAIRTHDGLYDEANKAYYMSYNPDAKFKHCMPHILHQADSMAAFIENKANKKQQAAAPIKKFTIEKKATAAPIKAQALPKATTPGLKNIMDDFFN